MKIKNIAVLLIYCLFGAGAPLLAQVEGIPVGGDKKIGFLQFALVLEGTEEAKLEIGKVRSYMEGKQADYDSQRTQLEELKKQYLEQERGLNEQTKVEMQRTITDNEKNLRRMQEDIQADISNRRDVLFNRLSGKVQIILNDFATQNNYGAILFVDQLQGYFDPSLDVTQEIIRLYNERHPVSAAGSTP